MKEPGKSSCRRSNVGSRCINPRTLRKIGGESGLRSRALSRTRSIGAGRGHVGRSAGAGGVSEPPVAPHRGPAGGSVRNTITPEASPSGYAGVRAGRPGGGQFDTDGFDRLFARRGIDPKVAAPVEDLAMVRPLARYDLGPALAPVMVLTGEITSGPLVPTLARPTARSPQTGRSCILCWTGGFRAMSHERDLMVGFSGRRCGPTARAAPWAHGTTATRPERSAALRAVMSVDKACTLRQRSASPAEVIVRRSPPRSTWIPAGPRGLHP